MLDWLILGGGIQGVLVTHWLITAKVVKPEGIRVLDRHDGPLDSWLHRTRAVGMDYLRSPSVHHLARDPMGLQKFAKVNRSSGKNWFVPPYSRPSLELFTRHCSSVLQESQLQSLWCQGVALRITRTDAGFSVLTESQVLTTKHLVLALGNEGILEYPEWAKDLIDSGKTEKVQHVFDKSFAREKIHPGERVLVVGGGISAAQTAIALAGRLDRPVDMYSRHTLRVHDFDSDPCWIGPKCMKNFVKTPSMAARRRLVKQARNKGSISTEVQWQLNQAVKSGSVCHAVRVINAARLNDRLNVEVSFADGKPGQTYDRVVLATGFSAKRPGGSLIDQLVQSENLPVADCGFPVLARDLTWTENLYAMGSLAELELGPSARNIVGGRNAAQRIIESVM